MRSPKFAPIRARQFERLEPRTMLSATDPAPAVEPPPLHLPGSISGAVVAASHSAALQSHAGAGVPGVQLELLDQRGRIVAAAVTDAFGQYEFGALAPGLYAIRQHQPAGLLNGQQWIGSGGGQAAAIDFISDIPLSAGAALTGYDFSEIVPAPPAPMTNLAAGAMPPAGPLSLVAATSPQRPAATAVAEFAVFERLAPPPPLPPALAAPPPEPVFGSSSRLLDSRGAPSEDVPHSLKDSEPDHFAQRDDAEQPEADGAPPAEEIRISRRPAPHAARDRAFEQRAQPEDDQQPPAAAPEEPAAAAR